MGGAISESLTQQGPSWACRVGRIRKRHKKEQNFPRSQGRGSDPTPCVGCLPSLASSTALGSQGLQVGLGELGSGQWPQGEENARAQRGEPRRASRRRCTRQPELGQLIPGPGLLALHPLRCQQPRGHLCPSLDQALVLAEASSADQDSGHRAQARPLGRRSLLWRQPAAS